MLKNKRKIIIIISAIALVAVICLLILFAAGVFSNQIKVKTLKEAYETAVDNGYKGSEEEFEKLVKYSNDCKENGISNIYVNDDKKIVIVLDSGKEIVVQKLTDNESKEIEIVTVTFKDYDGKVIKTENVIAGKSAIPPLEPQKEGYVFDGWDKSFSYVKKDLVVTAQYKKSDVPTINLSNVSVKEGTKTATVDVSLANNPGISSLVLDINYPKELKLKNVDFNQDNLDGGMSTTAEPFSNPQRISIINSTKEIKTNGVYATLTFELPTDLKADFSGSIIATYNEENVFDIDMNNVQFETINGKILISKK